MHKSRYLLFAAASAILCSTAWLAFIELPLQQAENQAASGKLRLLETALHAQVAVITAPPQNLPSQLANFDTLSQVTADLQTFAAQNGLLLSDASFKPAASAQIDTHTGRIEVTARIKGAYGPLKKTLATILATHPGLALESLSMRRARAADVVADIDLRFTYFYRD